MMKYHVEMYTYIYIYTITHLYHGLSVFIYDKDTSSKDRYQTWGYIYIYIHRSSVIIPPHDHWDAIAWQQRFTYQNLGVSKACPGT